MKILVRNGLVADIRTEWFERREITGREVKAIAYLFKVKRSLFKKSNHIFKLEMKDCSYWLSLKYESKFK